MFKFSLNWLRDYCGKSIAFEEILQKLRLQGFEFQGSQKVGEDTVTAIEVKANRPDMLSHLGIAREIKAFDGEKIPSIPKADIDIGSDKFPIKIEVNKEICKRFCALKIKDVDVSVSTPQYIKERLGALGINSVNAVVDICNYIMVDIGQPMHCYDYDKLIDKTLMVERASDNHSIVTFAGETAEVKSGDVIISNDSGIKCVAGIIGTDSADVTEKSQNIMLESAVFDEVSVRLTSRRLKISTPSSFRFERGVNVEASRDVLLRCAEMIIKVCSGKIDSSVFDYYPNPEGKKYINLSVENTNRLLGTILSVNTITENLEKYNFACTRESEDVIRVRIPDYRLDVKQEVDVIEEVARIYGYDNIKPIMPTIQTQYQKNETWYKSKILRDSLASLGFNETINYSFIPSDTMDMLNIDNSSRIYSDVLLQNPIGAAYALMRSTMVYSLMSCLAYNYSIGNYNLGLFELGRVYFKNSKFDTNCEEIDTCAFMMSGVRIPRGFGCDKDIKYTYYDLLNYLKIIFDKFGQKFELEKNDFKFLEEGSGYDIVVNSKKIGFIGELDKSKFMKVPNAKLIKNNIFYCEFYVNNICEKIKRVEFESKYPPIKRLYNLIQKKNIQSEEIKKLILSCSSVIRSVTVKDIYVDKTFLPDEYAVLYEVNYCSKTSTLTSEEIESIETVFLDSLSKTFGISLKS